MVKLGDGVLVYGSPTNQTIVSKLALMNWVVNRPSSGSTRRHPSPSLSALHEEPQQRARRCHGPSVVSFCKDEPDWFTCWGHFNSPWHGISMDFCLFTNRSKKDLYNPYHWRCSWAYLLQECIDYDSLMDRDVKHYAATNIKWEKRLGKRALL